MIYSCHTFPKWKRKPRRGLREYESPRTNRFASTSAAIRFPRYCKRFLLSGGLAQFTGSIGSATIAEAKVNTLSGPVSGLVEFLPAQVGSCTYPFRFIALSDQDYERLNSTLQYMQKQGYGD